MPALMSAEADIEIDIELVGRSFSDVQLAIIMDAMRQLTDGDPRLVRLVGAESRAGVLGVSDLEVTRQRFERWLAQPRGVNIEVSIHSESRIPAALLQLVGMEVHQGRPFGSSQVDHPLAAGAEFDLSAYLPCTAQNGFIPEPPKSTE